MVKNLPANAENRGSIPGWERYPLEQEMATHSTILAWKIPRMEEPGRLYSSWGHKRVRHDLMTKQQQYFKNVSF